jgi:hypothetical protein
MSRIRVTSNEVYLNRALRPEEEGGGGYAQGLPPGRDLHDLELESHAHRQHFQEGEGDISIIVEAGERLGEIAVCVQFEGQIVGQVRQKADACVARQNDLIQDSALWLHEILSQFESDFTASIVSAPCPLASTGLLDVRAAARRLTGAEVSAPVSVEGGPQVSPDVAATVRRQGGGRS